MCNPVLFPDATGQVGSCCSQTRFITGSDGAVSSPQQPVDISCKPWLPVSPSDDAFCVGHIIDALGDVRDHSVCVLLSVCVVALHAPLKVA